MFHQIRYRLLLSYLLVFASVLGSFALAVHFFVVHSYNEILNAKLANLGEKAIANTKLDQGRITLNDDAIGQDLLVRDKVIEWFDIQGNRIAQRGKDKLLLSDTQNLPVQDNKNIKKSLDTVGDSVPHALKKVEADSTNSNRIRSVILPLYSSDKTQPIGYLKVSQSLKELESNIQELDWGLGIGIVISLGLSGISGIFLTRQAMVAIEDSFQRLKQFTADASHELRSPLMAIKTNAKVALKYSEGIRKADLEKFEAIANATEQIKQLTEDLLFLARNEKLPQIEKKKINLTAILEDLIQLYYPSFEAKNISLDVNIDLNLTIFGDEGQIHRLFNNLITNALNYTPIGGRVEIKGQDKGNVFMIEIKDTGIGISPENLFHIFERFWRADPSRSYYQGGSGLGLAIAQTIAQNHDGSIYVTSQVDKGSCFTVTLPIHLKI